MDARNMTLDSKKILNFDFTSNVDGFDGNGNKAFMVVIHEASITENTIHWNDYLMSTLIVSNVSHVVYMVPRIFLYPMWMQRMCGATKFGCCNTKDQRMIQ